MFSDDEIKESLPEDEVISIREVCLINRHDKRYYAEPLLSNANQNDVYNSREANMFDVPRLFSFNDGLEQARFAWTEEDGNIASFVSEPGFGTGTASFGKDLEALTSDIKEADTSSSTYEINRNLVFLGNKRNTDPQLVSSTSASVLVSDLIKKGKNTQKIDKTDPRSKYHYVKYVKRHGRTIKLWECGICGREFQHQYTLMRHLPTHTDERNFHCDECSKSFRQLSTLSQHRAIHSAERPYACEVCNKTFNRVSTLISHRKTHSDDKPYKCHRCPKGFHQKGNLRNHLFTHTNERPYRCNICMKGFNQQSNLVCHKNKVHPEESDHNANKAKNVPVAIKADLKRSPEHSEVTSTVGLLADPPLWHNQKLDSKPDNWRENLWGNGVIVDPIKTYHMGIALATRQTPFALLKSDVGTPVLVKVVDTNMPGGKQMLVPATADDLKIGGKIILNNDDSFKQDVNIERGEMNEALQIRVPVVATVIPKVKAGGKLQLSVEEPHHAYNIMPCETQESNSEPCSSSATSNTLATLEHLKGLQTYNDTNLQVDSCSPPASLDLISLDLFEPIGCIPLGPQITSVDIDQPPPSEGSDIFIENFQEIIPLSDSD